MAQANLIPPLIALALAASASVAFAARIPVDPAPATVGVSNGTAVHAETNAVPRSDTGTLVRTDKSHRSSASASSARDTPLAVSAGNAIDNAVSTGPSKRVRHARN